MNNTRRLLLNDQLITSDNSLLFWCDGLNGINGNYWYAYKTSQALDGFYLKKEGNVATIANGWEIVYGNGQSSPSGAIYSESNPMVGLSGNNMTFIVVASNMRYFSSRSCGIIEITRKLYDYNKRQAVTKSSSTPFAITIRGYDTTSWSKYSMCPPEQINTSVVAYTSNGTTGEMYSEWDGVSKKESNHKAFKKDVNYNDIFLIVGGYEYHPFSNSGNTPGGIRSGNNWEDWPGKYHAVLMYDRVLSDSEISEITSFLKNRYNLS